MKKIIFISLFIFFVVLFPSLSALSWTGPTVAPPGGNVVAPLNVGAVAQTKAGALTVLGDTDVTTKGFMAGSSALILQTAQNLIYGNVDTTSVGNLLLLQKEDITKFVVDKDGKVGIGKTNPSATLDITSSDPTIRIANDNGGIISFTGNNNVKIFGSTSEFMSFYTNNQERMRINSLGNVGIGTITPGYNLDISPSSGNAIMRLNSFAENGYSQLIIGEGGLARWWIGSQGTNVLSFATEQVGNQKMVITNGGNVGIGTTDPKSTLHVVGLLEYADNDAAIAAGLTSGAFYRTGDIVKVVH